MIIVIKPDTPAQEIERVSQELRRWNIIPEKILGKYKVVIGLIGDTKALNLQQIEQLTLLFSKFYK